MEKRIYTHQTIDFGPVGLDYTLLEVEAVRRRGLPQLQITGLRRQEALAAVERLRSALYSLGVRLPLMTLHLHLTPADPQRLGSHFDLPLALSILELTGQPLAKWLRCKDEAPLLFAGELSITGAVILSADRLATLMRAARERSLSGLVTPVDRRLIDQLPECGLPIWPITHLRDLLADSSLTKPLTLNGATTVHRLSEESQQYDSLDALSALRLPLVIQRGIVAAAAGWHPTLLFGPPGCGKSSAARLITALLPQPDEIERLELFELNGSCERPLRTPHHTATVRAMVGGGQPIEPGEATRSHNGVMILDELAEFSRPALQALREPLESGVIDLSRSSRQRRLPARFLLIGTGNLCPCGETGTKRSCRCAPSSIRSYLWRISGALLDRIDIEMKLLRLSREEQVASEAVESIDINRMIAQIARAREIQEVRFRNYSKSGRRLRFNHDLEGDELEEFAPLSGSAEKAWRVMIASSQISWRRLHSIRRLARTFTDLQDDEGPIGLEALNYAASYRLVVHDSTIK